MTGRIGDGTRRALRRMVGMTLGPMLMAAGFVFIASWMVSDAIRRRVRRVTH